MLDKKDYIERVAQKLMELDAVIDDLKARAELAHAEEKVRYGREVVELREKRERGSEILRDLHEACEDEWDEVRRNAENLLSEPISVFRKAA